MFSVVVRRAAICSIATSSILGAAIAIAACGGDSPTSEQSNSGDSTSVRDLSVGAVAGATINGTTYNSSTRLAVSWKRPVAGTVVSYRVRVTDLGTNSAVTFDRPAGDAASMNVALDELKAETAYRVAVTPCITAACADGAPNGTSIAVTTTTAGEVWQLQGTGATVAGLTHIVTDGNVKLHVSRYGADAPAALAGKLLMYYGPLQAAAKGLAASVTTSAASANLGSSYLSFASHAGVSGLLNPPSPSLLVRDVATGQGVPLSAAMGGRIRLFFEAADANNRTRILSIDSQDGYTGLDFNSGAGTVCATTADYSSGGRCAPSVVIGLEGDANNANARILNARQFKIGYPTQTDWRWDGSIGTFMLFTVDAVTGCSTAQHNFGYAVWNGSQWVVQYEAGGCPKLLKSMQAAHPLHIGGTRYKLYYGDPSDVTGRVEGSPLPFLGPKKLLYADGATSGDALRVDFEDWENVAAGRTISFLWPTGAALNATARGYIDDFSVAAPTGSLSLQVLYVAITDGTAVPFAAAAVLVNP